MTITLDKAVSIIERGEAEEYVLRFIKATQWGFFGQGSAVISLDDAVISAMVLAKLLDTADGRKLFKKPKRKNVQYSAKKYTDHSPERKLAREYLAGKISRQAAIDKLEATFDGDRIPDRERTLRRLFDDLVECEVSFGEIIAELLRMGGWDGKNPESRNSAANKIAVAVGLVTSKSK